MANIKHRFQVVYEKLRNISVFALVGMAFFASKLGLDKVKEASIYAALFIVIAILLDIYKQTIPKDKTLDGYKRFNDASLDFRNKIDALVRHNSDISIHWIGMTMEYGGPALLDIISSINDKDYTGKVSVSIVMMDPNNPYLNKLNSAWKLQINTSLRTLIARLNPSHSELYSYSHVPNWHGFLLNDQHLYLSTCRWNGASGKLIITGGENSYTYFDAKENSDQLNEVTNFKKWHEFSRQIHHSSTPSKT